MLRLHKVNRTYGHEQVRALIDATLSIQQGDLVTISGPSGSGKSTLLNILGLLDRPDSGAYEILGVETGNLSPVTLGDIRSQLFGFVFQAFHLIAGRTALENVELGMVYSRVDRRRRRKIAREVLDSVGLGARIDADTRTLSGGEKQRVAIARAIAGSPRVLFCDEPTGNLDSVNTQRILELIQDLHRSGLTVIVVTHDPDVASLGSRILTVADGVVTESTAARPAHAVLASGGQR
ncbi:ABC transporter ATP-binding protein [Actinoplanes siamensis]|uniref:ABC transporter ATP-binding protein YvrO n=1 Tax=Actinoplanes siamensis TaxID=1223317 RepID=A0A919N206_9ACTN|nr:ABC transporter ATP-binding protein [Actinoplanes siamensis]GIF02831.1 putative ABC transporter ATP-binding protein YvrO [Actinoplanes siamensis]